MKSTILLDKEVLQDVLGSTKDSNKHLIAKTCPFCHDSSWHFYVNFSKEGHPWDCKKCEARGGIKSLLDEVGRSDIYDELITFSPITQPLLINKIGVFNSDQKKDLTISTSDVFLPVGYRQIVNHHEYLTKRGFTRLDYSEYNVGTTLKDFKLRDYVIFPVEEGENIKGYVCRYFGTESFKPRYKNSSNVEFEKLIYGYNLLNVKIENVIIVEGVFDMIAVNRFLRFLGMREWTCIATFGKKISGSQITKIKLRAMNVQNVHLMFDLDAIQSSKHYVNLLKGNFLNVYSIYNHLGKDPDEITVEQFKEVINVKFTPFLYNLNIVTKKKLR